MKRFFLPKNYLSFILIVIMLFGRNFSFAQTAQTGCGWQQGEFSTYTQSTWGTTSTDASDLLFNQFSSVYFAEGGVLEVGLPGIDGNSLSFTTGASVVIFLPASGTAAPLTNDAVNPTTTSGGILAGETVALQVIVDFNDAGVLQGSSSLLFGDLVLQGTTLSAVNGLTVREVLAIAVTVLGGGSASVTPLELVSMLQNLNAAFANGTPSQFAQDHLKRVWQIGDFTTYGQNGYNDNLFQIITSEQFSAIFASDFGVVEVGILGAGGYSMRFAGTVAVVDYLTSSGSAAPLSADLLNPTTSASGVFGGEVLALTLNVIFSDSGILQGNFGLTFGDILLQNFGGSLSSLNGLTIRQFNALANTILGGSSSSYSISDINSIAGSLNSTFYGPTGTPSQFAQDHLVAPCQTTPVNNCPIAVSGYDTIQSGFSSSILLSTLVTDPDGDQLHIPAITASHGEAVISFGFIIYQPDAGFAGNDTVVVTVSDDVCEVTDTIFVTVTCPTVQSAGYKTYSQLQWGDESTAAGILLELNFNNLYPTYLTVATPNQLYFDNAASVFSYLPAIGPDNVLTTTIFNPLSTSAGGLGGEVVALKLNVDFSDANLLGGIMPFGDLVFRDVTTLPILNGQSVRQVLTTVAGILGGNGSNVPYTPSVASAIAHQINFAFIDGVPTQFALDYLMTPCEIVPVNHCPATTASSVATAIGTAINIQLQAADEDNDALTYSISQNPLHGTVSVSTTGLATYTPTAGYSGTDQFKFKASDGTCDAEAAVDISIVVCPKGKGDWKNKPANWPVSSLTLGAQTYTKTELFNILNMPVGSGQKADASLILAHQLIAAKLSIANNTVGGSIAATIAHADALLSAFSGKLPYKVKPNTTAGKAMTADATLLENFNGGSQTTGCIASQPAARLATIMEAAPINFILEQNQPNPFYNTSVVRYHLPVDAANYRVTLKLYDVLGREIKTLVDETQAAGIKTISFNAASLSGGVYYYRLTAGKFAAVRKMILVK